jgi:hypothetical protein
VFPVRYELNSYILFRRISVFKGLKVPCSRVYLYFRSVQVVKTLKALIILMFP